MSLLPALCLGGFMLFTNHYLIPYEPAEHPSKNGLYIILFATTLQIFCGVFAETPNACKTILAKMAYFTYNNLIITNFTYWSYRYNPAFMYLARLTSTITASLYILCVLPYEGLSILNILAHILPFYTVVVYDYESVGVRDRRIIAGFFIYYFSVLVYVNNRSGEYPYTFLKRFTAIQLFTFMYIVGILFDSVIFYYI